MAENTTANFVIPELLSEQIVKGIAGRTIMLGSEAVISNPSFPTGYRGGKTIKVPYLGHLGEAEILADGAELALADVTPDSETADVQRAGKAFTLTRWAEVAAQYADPYVEFGKMISEAITRAYENALITAATASLPSMTHTVSGSGTLDYDAVIAAKKKWGDEIDDVVMIAMHSKAFYDVLSLKDSTGRPLGVETIRDDGSVLRSFAGCPVFVSDLMPLSSGVYTTALFKRGALLLYVQKEPMVEEISEPRKFQRSVAVNSLFCAHRYKCLPGRTKPGVALLKHA